MFFPSPCVSFLQWQHRRGHGDTFEELSPLPSQTLWQPQSGRFSNYDFPFNKTASAHSTVLAKSSLFLKVTETERQMKKDPRWPGHLGFCMDSEQWPTSKLADVIMFVKARTGHYRPSSQNKPHKLRQFPKLETNICFAAGEMYILWLVGYESLKLLP